MLKIIKKIGFSSVIAACIAATASVCSAKTNLMELNSVLNKLDPNTSSFLLKLIVQKEQIIENDRYFAEARKLLPVTYDNYHLTEMSKSDHELFLIFNTEDPKVPELWKTNRDQIKLKFFKAVCKGFTKYRFKKMDEVTVTVNYNSKHLTSLNLKKSSCPAPEQKQK